MDVERDDLADYTWFKIGGPAEIIKPTSKVELVDAIEWCVKEGREYRVLGNGSNVLISDDGIDETVIENTNAATNISVSENRVTAGSSVLLPQFINVCISNDLGGIEYLYSVPGTIGGALFMNAGRGKGHELTISDHLHCVEIHDGTQVRELKGNDLNFEHRYSTFQEHDEWVILSATFDLPSQPEKKGREKVRKRMEHVKQRERSLPTAGSVFKSGQRLPQKGLKIGDAKYVANNRICNLGNANCKDVRRLIWLTKTTHRLIPFIDTPEVEIVIWE